MTRTLFKDALRSISANRLRFISAVIIIALGISFFTGIRSSFPEMRYSANEYFNDNNLADIRVTSQIAFTDSDIDKIKELDSVAEVAVSHYTDVFVTVGENLIPDSDGSDLVCRVNSLDIAEAQNFYKNGTVSSDYVNRLNLKSGRYPEKANECLVDSAAAEKYEALSLGRKIMLTGDGETVSSEIKNTEFTVVGTVYSPMYISSDRGQTDIGSGIVGAFICVPDENFEAVEANELFVVLDDSYDKFTDEYEKNVMNVADEISKMSVGIIDSRLSEIKSDYSAKITAKQTEIENYTKESEKRLADKKSESEKLGSDVENSDSIIEKLKETQANTTSAAKSKLESLTAQLTEKTAECDEAVKKHDNMSSEIKGYSELKSLYDELNSKHTAAKSKLDGLKAKADEASAALTRANETYNSYSAQATSLQKKIADYNNTVSTLQSENETLAGQKSATESNIKSLESSISSLNSKIKSLEEKESAGTISVGERLQLSGYKSELYSKNNELSSAQSKLSGINSQISSNTSAINSAKNSASAASAELSSVNSKLSTAQMQKNSAQSAYDDAKANYDSAKKDYDADTATLKKYVSSMEQLTEGKADISALSKQIESLNSQIESLKVRTTEAQIDYSLAVRNSAVKIKNEEYSLKAAKAKYNAADEEYKELETQVQNHLADLNGDLGKLKNTLKNIDSITWEAETQTEFPGHASLKTGLENGRYMSQIFPYVFIVVAMLACFVIMARNVDDDRSQIGLYKALGYSGTAITLKYVIYALLAWVVGAAIGLLFGTVIYPRIINALFSISFNFPSIGTTYNNFYVKQALLISVSCVPVAAFAAGLREVTRKPAELMRPRAINYTKRSLFEKIPAFWNNMSYGMVLATRAVGRGRKRVTVGIIGIACCTALILSAFGLANSSSQITKLQYGDKGIFRYDVQLTFESDQDEDDSAVLRAIASDNRTQSVMLAGKLTAEFSAKSSGEKQSAQIIVPQNTENFSDYIGLKSVDGSVNPSDGLILTEKLANDIGASVGDTVKISDMSSEIYSAQVAGIAENYSGNYAYCGPGVYSKIFSAEPEYKFGFCIVKDYLSDNDKAAYASDFLKNENVSSAVTASALARSVGNSVDKLISVAVLFIFFAAVLCSVVIYTITGINIDEREREIANIKVLGFSDNETMIYVSRESIFSCVVGLAAGLVGGIFLHRVLLSMISVDNVTYSETILWWSYFATAFVVCASALASFLPVAAKIKKISMAETIKSDER